MRATAFIKLAAAAVLAFGASAQAQPYRGSSCPLGVDGATIAESDTPAGVDITIIGTTETAERDIRLRARDAAKLYGPGARRGKGHHGVHLGGERHGLRLTEMPPIDVRVEDVPGGVWMHVIVKDPAAHLNELRRSMRARVAEIQQGPCEWIVP